MAEKTTERWTYTGRRKGAKNRTYYAWIDPHGKERYYGKLKATVVGGVYEVGVERDSENVSVYLDVKYVDRVAPELRVDWEVKDRARMVEVEQERLVKRDSADSEFTNAIAPLRDLMAKQRTYSQRAALIALVLAEIGR